ncbi:hypothetical protein FM113_01505 [Leucobacter sp. 7(1)]|nr:hypothetical protein FM113_01505 [Leucobacter sp. 7(1)]
MQRRRAAVLAALIWAAVALSILGFGLPSSIDAMAIVAVAGGVGLGFGLVWAQFQSAVGQLCVASAAATQQVFWADLDARAARGAQRSYLRWIEVGLDPAIGLLREIVAGTRPVHLSATRRACGSEELYLRQVIQVGPELVHLGPRVFPALRRAHDQGVDLTLRLGDQDAADAGTAMLIAAEITTIVESAAETDRVTASLFPVREGLQLTLIRVSGGTALRPQPSRSGHYVSPEIHTAQFLFPGSVHRRL